jgi:hypothetical protein
MDNSCISKLLTYLYNQREQIESTGYRIDPDLRKVYRFINYEIQNLQMMNFKNRYEEHKGKLTKELESLQETNAV